MLGLTQRNQGVDKAGAQSGGGLLLLQVGMAGRGQVSTCGVDDLPAEDANRSTIDHRVALQRIASAAGFLNSRRNSKQANPSGKGGQPTGGFAAA